MKVIVEKNTQLLHGCKWENIEPVHNFYEEDGYISAMVSCSLTALVLITKLVASRADTSHTAVEKCATCREATTLF